LNRCSRILFALSVLLALTHCTSLHRGEVKLGTAAWTSFDGKQMPWKAWPAPAGVKPKAVIIAVHGLSGATSDFWPLGEALPAQGFPVYAFELRGQGHDPMLAQRGDISTAKQWLRDLHAFHALIQKRHRGVPIIWYGESLGSLIALHAAAQPTLRRVPDALIFASPLAGLRQKPSELELVLLKSMSYALPTLKVKLGDLAHMDESKIKVTSTSTHGGQMAITAHHVAAFSLRLLREIDDLLIKNEASAKRLRVPVLMLASPHDIVASPDQVHTLFRQIESRDKSLRWYPRSYHLLLHDVQRDQVVRDVQRWLERR
jgi:acylglycerol lipase